MTYFVSKYYWVMAIIDKVKVKIENKTLTEKNLLNY